MKTLFNKFMMAIVAVVMVIGFSAFKMVEKKNTIHWFTIDNSNTPGDISDYKGADEVGESSLPEDCGTGFQETCAVAFYESDLPAPGIAPISNLSELPSSGLSLADERLKMAVNK